MRSRSAAFFLVLAFASAPYAMAGSTAGPARDERENIGTVRGPLSDFWIKVRSEWSGYLSEETGTSASGSGPLRSTLRTTPAPNRVWVSLVYGDMKSAGDEKTSAALSHLFEEFLLEWKTAEGRNWPYAQIFDRLWEKMGQAGRSQNIIMIGTPWTLPPVGPLAASLGFTIAPGRVDIGKRKYRGDNLVLVFIAPNPINPEKYALVLTGTSDESLLQARHLPYGETDYVLFRGRRLLESGSFTKPAEKGWGPPEIYEAHGSHHGFAIRESPHYTFWYEKESLSREDLDALALQKESAFADLARRVPERPGRERRLTYYLYPTVDRKIDETARDEIAHVDMATGEIHTVYSRTQRVVEPYLDLMVLLHRSVGPTRVPRLERALSIALAPTFQGRQIGPLAQRIFSELGESQAAALRSLRDQDVMTPADGPPAGPDVLLAGFVQDLVRRDGAELVCKFLERATPRRLSDTFRETFNRSLGDALDEWGAGLRPAQETTARKTSDELKRDQAAGTDAMKLGLDLLRARRDSEAQAAFRESLAADPDNPTARSSQARLLFRDGSFDAAETEALAALSACAGSAGGRQDCVESAAWSHLTLGRIEAIRGRLVAAHVELTHPAIKQGPEQVLTLADYWLLTMGESRNQLTVVSHLKREARVSLRSLEWDDAETSLKKALEIDPTDGEAHRLLSDVYHKHHEYWAWRVRYLNEIHPDFSVLGRVFVPRTATPIVTHVEDLHTLDSFNDLVLRGNLELLKAQSLYAVEIQNLHAEGDRLLIERQDVEEALKVYRRALELNNDFFLSHFLVGRCLFLMNRNEEARAAFEEVLARRPTDALVLAWTHTYLGYLSLEADDLTGAAASFERALARVSEGKAASMAREGLGKVSTIRLLQPNGPTRQ
ncbi:MAG TPA: tetratricopeptide repeat protein [Candidatus Polarisedimenticolia bacterium]|nr:tetratricopeptide repeat protein [Candidatus Polarisedimenticolia bacterium]